MMVLLLLVLAVFFGLGFLNSLWWVAAALLIFGLMQYGRHRSRGGYRDYEEYRDDREREDRWGRRYARRHRSGWMRGDREHYS
ncbi:hypothetical protein GCM10010329_19140 [Streptomyces spiroverticillatus]|uniref:Uncharacterized protein n=1 Tax=Streptomyces finlayi TaxID=67296 RepID=A0A919C8G6_9ACTN|nr:hypothetical protein [Streptomyces finlayi]GGZ97963.1 hypothetical protein GCM10010329_19140 [Streptomyces spiroverticillatus]GHC82941.1 hypothetical protein GCM10010334_11620 [Streptomyces finlayi]